MSKVGSPAWFKPTRLFVLCAELQGGGSGSGRGVSWTPESRLNSRHSPPSEATMNLVCLRYNLSYILCVFARARCQTHWLWKNNLTGFNLLPPSPLPPPSSSLFPLAFCFFLLLCASERLGLRLVWQLHAQSEVPLRVGWARFHGSFWCLQSSVFGPWSHVWIQRTGSFYPIQGKVFCLSSVTIPCYMFSKLPFLPF